MAVPPPKCGEMGTFYLVLGTMELTAEFGYTTEFCLLTRSLLMGATLNDASALPQKPPCSTFWERQPLLKQPTQLGIRTFDRAYLKSKTLSMLIDALALIG